VQARKIGHPGDRPKLWDISEPHGVQADFRAREIRDCHSGLLRSRDRNPGSGSGLSRLGNAIGQTFWTHSDSGRTQFNYSEILGNSTAVAISNAYYQDNRGAASALTKLGTQIGVDLAANVLKEFSSDLNRKLFRRHYRDQSPTP
jgi:hypothetical protein